MPQRKSGVVYQHVYNERGEAMVWTHVQSYTNLTPEEVARLAAQPYIQSDSMALYIDQQRAAEMARRDASATTPLADQRGEFFAPPLSTTPLSVTRSFTSRSEATPLATSIAGPGFSSR